MWAGDPIEKTTAQDDLALMGADPSILEVHSKIEEGYEVFEENWESLQVFLRLASQWTYSFGTRIGLNYQSVETFFRLVKIKNRELVFEDLQIMEFAVLETDRENKSGK